MIDHLEEKIYKEIEKNERIRYNELKRIMVDKRHVMSERTFRNRLDEMVKNKLVSRNQLEKQKVVYSITVDAISKELEINEGMMSNLKSLEIYFESIENKINGLSTYDRALLSYSLYQVFMYQELFYRIARTGGVSVSKELVKKIEELKSRSFQILQLLESEEKQKTLQLIKKMMLQNSTISSGQFFTTLNRILK